MSHRNWREICGELSREKNSERFHHLLYELLEALDDYERKRERDQQLQDLESLSTDSTLE